ncbi:MAG TPA: glycosyltransferase family 2 protein [Acidimicrobiales bacterium]|nr:glycosyltransferase family 2 protein [Acidimicrobiales bacterium]
MAGPEISVVIPTYRRPQLLAGALASLSAQDIDSARFEVVVADDGSGDATPQVVEEVAAARGNVKLVSLDRNSGPAAARNRGVAAATAPLILFIDDDIEAIPGLVRTHLTTHGRAGDPKFGVLGLVRWSGRLRITRFMRWLDRSGHQFAYDTWLFPGPVDPPYGAFYTANLSMHRVLFEEVGGFDERFPYASFEDLELAWRLSQRGFRLEYHPEAVAFHARPVDLATFRRRTANDAESAQILRQVQPDFPLDEGPRQHGYLRRRRRLLLQAVAPLADLVGRSDVRARWYQAEVAAAYREGMARAAGTLGPK